MSGNPNQYVTDAALKATLALTGTSFADPDVTVAALGASRIVDEETGRRFWADADANQARVYSPESPTTVIIDDLVTLTSLKVDRDGDGVFEETWTSGTQFVLGPDNAAADYVPFQYVSVRRSYGWPRFVLPRHEQSVQVTGKFGWSAVPEAIQAATSIIASRLLKRSREAPFGVLLSQGLESASAVRISRIDPDVAPILAQYTRHRPFV